MTRKRKAGKTPLAHAMGDEQLPDVMLNLADKLDHLPPDKVGLLFAAIASRQNAGGNLTPSAEAPDIDWDAFDEALAALTQGDTEAVGRLLEILDAGHDSGD